SGAATRTSDRSPAVTVARASTRAPGGGGASRAAPRLAASGPAAPATATTTATVTTVTKRTYEIRARGLIRGMCRTPLHGSIRAGAPPILRHIDSLGARRGGPRTTVPP